MLLLRALAPWLLLAFLGQQVLLSSGRNEPAVTGNFSILSGKMQCNWEAGGDGGEVRLAVKCENQEARLKGRVTILNCEYSVNSESCPRYVSNPRSFWKQVSRAIKRPLLCMDEDTLVKACMCKSKPRGAYFELFFSSVPIAEEAQNSTSIAV